MNPEIVIRILTISSLAGLLFAVGLRLRFVQVAESIRRCRFTVILLVNFLAVPVLGALVARLFDLDRDTTIAMVILGSAPFAPVVPVFARMARADLALAAGLTSIYPVLSALITPWVCDLVLHRVAEVGVAPSSSWQVMAVLVCTTSLPLVLGVAINHLWPRWAVRFLRPIEIISEATGALSLCFVTAVEFRSILGIGGTSLLAMAILFELCLLAGYALGTSTGTRRVVALGTSNRNIALAILVALQSFGGLHVVSVVVGNGLLLILFGLLHVGYWRLRDRSRPAGCSA